MSEVLIIEDDPDVGPALCQVLKPLGVGITLCVDARTARHALDQAVFDLILLDLGLPDEDGMSFLEWIASKDPLMRVIVLTGRNDAAVAVKALQVGAVDYIVKPFQLANFLHVVKRALAEASIRQQLEAAKAASGTNDQAVGSSPDWTRTLKEARDAAESPRTAVLITGESGTGKEVVASLIHRWSRRASGPFVTLNAACLPATMLESELFGHESGAFTSARGSRRGMFELASGGTLFLDEIGELPLELQPKLLRALEGHTFRRLGGEREVKVDVRLVTATNRDLGAMIEQGRFREDLLYRLRVIEIRLPPLRTRTSDIPALVAHFCVRFGAELGKPAVVFSPAALARMAEYSWPGNVRELRNVVERALIVTRTDTIEPRHLTDLLPTTLSFPPIGSHSLSGQRSASDPLLPALQPTEPACRAENAASEEKSSVCQERPPSFLSLDDALREHVLLAYRTHGFNISHAAAALKITRVALRRKLREFGAYLSPDEVRRGDES